MGRDDTIAPIYVVQIQACITQLYKLKSGGIIEYKKWCYTNAMNRT